MLIYGYHPVREALLHRANTMRRVWILRPRADRRRNQIEGLCRKAGVGLATGSPPKVPEDVVSNGFVAELHDAPLKAFQGGDLDLQVLLEDVQDPRNLGAILRVCEGAGVGRVLIRDRGSAPLTPTVVKTSSGATEWLDVERVVNSARSLDQLKKEGYWVYGLVPEGGPSWEIDLTGKIVLCLGGEGSGLRRRTRDLCDGLVGLPMQGRVESLNVSTAAAAVLFEALRQRKTLPGEDVAK